MVRKECREIAMKGTRFCCVMMHSRLSVEAWELSEQSTSRFWSLSGILR